MSGLYKPEDMNSEHPERDAEICNDFSADDMDFAEIAEKHNLSERRIRQILAEHFTFKKINHDWEKAKRLNRLKRWIAKNPDTKKDPLEIQQELRKEIEGERPLIDNSTKITAVTYVWQDDNNSVLPPEIPARDSQVTETI